MSKDISLLKCLDDIILDVPLLVEEDWLIARKSGIGGSDTPQLLGLSPWGGPASVYASKLVSIPNKPTISMMRGNYLEPLVISLFKEKVNFHVVHTSMYHHDSSTGEIVNKLERVFEHPYIPFIKATPDAFLYDHENDRIGVLEIKTAAGYGTAKFDDGIPDMYSVQLQQYMMVTKYLVEEITGRDVPIFGYIAYLLNDSFNYSAEYTEDIALWKVIESSAVEFWSKHIVPMVPPEADTLEEQKLIYANIKSVGKKFIDENILYSLKQYKDYKDALKDINAPTNKIKQEIENLQLLILKEIENNEELIYGNDVVATYKTDKNNNKTLRVKYAQVEKLINDIPEE